MCTQKWQHTFTYFSIIFLIKLPLDIMTVCLFVCAATTPHSPLSLWIFIRQRKANYLQQACCRVTSRKRVGGMLTIIQPSRSEFDQFTLKNLAASIHCALGNPLKRKSLSASFFGLRICLPVDCRERCESEGETDGLLWAESEGERCLDDFFNLGNIVFTHTSHCFCGCEEARNHPINESLSGVE